MASRAAVLVSMASALMLLLGAQDSAATLILPDAEFSFAAPTLDAGEATEAIATALAPLGFEITQRPSVRDGKFFRAEFERPAGGTVHLSGRVSCTHVGIYIFGRDKSAETAAEAAEIHEALLASLRPAENFLLFKSARGKASCDEAL
jgi:hypothetical protein